MIHGQTQPMPYVLADQRAVNGPREQPVRVPLPHEFLDPRGGGQPLPYGAEGALECDGDGLMPGSGGKQAERPLHGGVETLPAGESVHDDGVSTGGQIPDGMPMGLSGTLHGELHHELRLPPHEQPKRRGTSGGFPAHLARILGRVERPHPLIPKPQQTGPSWIAPRIKPLLARKPPIILTTLIGPPVMLGRGPPQIGPMQIGRRMPGPGIAPHLSADQPIDGKQTELREMSDGPPPPIPEDEIHDALSTVGLPDLIPRQQIHRRTERVPHGGPEQRPPHPTPKILLLHPTPDGRGRRTHQGLLGAPSYVRVSSAL